MSDTLDGSWNKLGSPDVTITRQVRLSDMLDGSWSNWVPPDVTITRKVRYVRHVRRQLEQTGFP